MGQSPTFPWCAWETAQARDSSHVALWTRPLSSGSREKSVFGMPNGSECWVAHSMDVAWPCHPAPVPGNLGIWHCFLCQDRHSHAFHLEPFPYISLSFPIPREDEGRRGVNRMPRWPCSARFTCPVLLWAPFVCFPTCGDACADRWMGAPAHFAGNPGQPGWLISQSTEADIGAGGSPWWIHSAKSSAQSQGVITSICQRPNSALCSTCSNTPRSPRLFSGVSEGRICFQGYFSQARCWKMTVSFC